MRLSHLLWGGPFNPILPIGDDTALSAQLVKLFRVDLLYAVATNDRTLLAFIDQFPHLESPFFHSDALNAGEDGAPLLLDVGPLATMIRDDQRGSESTYHPPATIPTFNDDDPLRDIALATFGALPDTRYGAKTEESLFRLLTGNRTPIDPEAPLLPSLLDSWTPNNLTRYGLTFIRSPRQLSDGFYCGSADDFDDLVAFWNLRASGSHLLFYDARHKARLDSLSQHWLAGIESRFPNVHEWHQRVSLFRRSESAPGPETKLPTVLSTVSSVSWNGLNLKPGIVGVDAAPAYGNLSIDGNRASLSIPITPLGFVRPRSDCGRQHVVVDLHPRVYRSLPDGLTFQWFNIAQLNEHYSRGMLFKPSAVRLSDTGLGVVIGADWTRIEIQALRERELTERIFALAGIDATVSKPGLVTNRLIGQMGGFQGCRIFKIRGVRELIRKYDPLESFTRSAATQLIADLDPTTHGPRFADYQKLFIEQRQTPSLTPDAAFAYLLKKHVLRVGLELECPYCHLRFWRDLDTVTVNSKCEYCGDEFNASVQLRDRDWRFRRSGLFGQKDNQHGAIPVALTLQQLDTNLSYDQAILTASWELRGNGVATCETDLVVIGQGHDGKVDMAVGECKATGFITEDDVAKLTGVVERIESTDLSPYLIFAKTAPFTQDEIGLCQQAQSKYRHRVILLGPRELELYQITERTAMEFESGVSDMSLTALATMTENVYFNPRPRPQPQG